MADKETSALTAAGTLTGTELVHVVQSSNSRKATAQAIADLAGAAPSGTSFPGSPATGARFLRTDRHILYYYDGTRWLSETLYSLVITGPIATTTTTTSAVVGLGPHPHGNTYDIYGIDVVFGHIVSGTANFTGRLVKDDGGALTVLASSPAYTNTTRSSTTVSLNTVLPSTIDAFYMDLVKNSGTGSGSGFCAMTYRLIG